MQESRSIRAYYEDTYLAQIETEVLAHDRDERGSYIITATTLFHPKGGGQPNDEGYILFEGECYPVRSLATNEQNEVMHYIDGEWGKDLVGKQVLLSIHKEKRVCYAAYHTAGHLIAHLIEKKYPTLLSTKGSHFPGKASILFVERSNPEKPTKEDFALYDLDQLKSYVEEATEAAIKKDLKLSIDMGTELRKIEIEGLGAFSCGGTHLRSLSAIEEVVIKKIKFKKKEGLKISYEVECRI